MIKVNRQFMKNLFWGMGLISILACSQTSKDIKPPINKKNILSENEIHFKDTIPTVKTIRKKMESEIILERNEKGEYLSELKFKNTNGEIIKRLNWRELNPYLKDFKIIEDDSDYSGLLYLGKNTTKKDIRKFFTTRELNKIPEKYSFDYANSGPPKIFSNGNNLFVVAFDFEWGHGLLNEMSGGEFKSSTIFFYDSTGNEMKKMILDSDNVGFPYPTNNGKYYWFGYINDRNGAEVSCIKLMDFDSDEQLYDKCFSDKELFIKGNKNSIDNLFRFSTSQGQEKYDIYFFDDEQGILYYKTFQREVKIQKNKITLDDYKKIFIVE